MKEASNNQNCHTCDTHATQPERGCAERLEFVLVRQPNCLRLYLHSNKSKIVVTAVFLLNYKQLKQVCVWAYC